MRRRYRRSTVDVPVNIGDVLEELDDEELHEELMKRKIGSTLGMIDSDWLDRLHWYLMQKDVHGALAMVSAALTPARQIAAKQLGLGATQH